MTQWLWTAADGTVTDLSAWSSGTYVLAGGTSGVLAPEYEFITQSYAGVDGEEVQDVTARPGQPVLGMDFVAADPDELRTRIRALAHALRPKAGIGMLSAVAGDGATRNLPCYYRKGLESGTLHAGRYRAALQFWGPSPWWRGDPLTADWGLATPTEFFPFPPLVLSATTITGARTLDLSDTDAPTHPVWTVTGPGEQLTVTHEGTGRALALNATIGDGQLVVIDTRPGGQSVHRATRAVDGTVILGDSIFGALASDPAMFPLIDGVNEVTALLTNAGPASNITVIAERLYSGAL